MNEIARNNDDDLTKRSFNNQCQSHMSRKRKNKEEKEKKKTNKKL